MRSPLIYSLNHEAIENLNDGYYLLDSSFRYVYLNKKGLEFADKPIESFIGKKIDEIYPGVFKTSTGKAIKKAIATKKVQQLEMYYSHYHRWLLNTIYPLEDGIAIQVHDISIRKNNESNLLFLAKVSKELATTLSLEEVMNAVANVSVPEFADWCKIDLLNSSGELELFKLVHKNPEKVRWAMKIREQIFPKKVAPRGLFDVLKNGTSQLFPHITERHLKKAARNEKELTLLNMLGLTSVMIIPIIIKKKVIGGITFVTTESRKHFTNSDLATAEELASRAALAIENADLHEQAQQAVRLRNEFISIASHELKTPVTSIKAYGQVLQRRFMRSGNTQAAEQLGKMDDQLNRLTNLISDLLDVTKIETGKLQLHNDFYEFDALIAESIEEVQRTVDTHTIVLEGSTKKKIYGDRERTGQVLTNLLSNAIKYSPEKKKIIVSIKSSGEYVEGSVKDFGVGISKEKQDKVFERFYRASGPKDNTFPGLGLGLYISSEIIKRQGGKIWLESKEGKGSTFRFSLPIFTEK